MRRVPLPPEHMPAWHGGRPRKAWRWVGVFAPGLVVCAGRVDLAGLPQRFWAVWERGHALRGHTALGASPVRTALDEAGIRVREQGVELSLRLEPAGQPVTVRSPHGSSWIWTRKQPVRAVGTLWLDGRRVCVDAPGLRDDSAGFHAHRTEWRWAAGAGTDVRGRPVTWNLVDGVHDAASGSERRVWVDGVPREVGPVRFAAGLDAVEFAEGGALSFVAGAVRERHDRLIGGLVRSDYRQPLGDVTGELPGGVHLHEAAGVMEDHRARW